MYEFIKGQLIEKTATRAVVDVHGVGYEIRIPVSTFAKLPSLGESVQLLTHFVVREDAQQLFGFYTAEERELFRLLLSVSGIGPKMGVTILSGMTIPELKQAIIQGAVQTLTSIPGIGRKTAERVVVELREKVVLEESQVASVAAVLGSQEAMMNDSLQALMELGYKKQDAKASLQKALKEMEASGTKASVSELVRKALKYA